MPTDYYDQPSTNDLSNVLHVKHNVFNITVVRNVKVF